jgi:hypothetical protein
MLKSSQLDTEVDLNLGLTNDQKQDWVYVPNASKDVL